MRYFQGGPEVTASLASPNIHHCVYASHFNCVLQHLHLFINYFSRIKFLALAQGGPQKNFYMAPCSKCLKTPDLEKL